MLNTFLGLLRRPFVELYITHSGPALRLSAAIFTAIIHDKIAQSWKTKDTQNKSNWEQVAAILLAGVQVVLAAFSDSTLLTIVLLALGSCGGSK